MGDLFGLLYYDNNGQAKILKEITKAVERMKYDLMVLKLQSLNSVKKAESTIDGSITPDMAKAMDIEDSKMTLPSLPNRSELKKENVNEKTHNGDELYIDTTNSCLQDYQNLYGFDGLDTRELDDEVIHNDLANCRHTFLEVCQFKNLQFDSLRRAKYSSALIIQYLHDPSSRRLSFACSSCGNVPDVGGIRWFHFGRHQMMFCSDCVTKVQTTKKITARGKEKGKIKPALPVVKSKSKAGKKNGVNEQSLIPIRASFSGPSVDS